MRYAGLLYLMLPQLGMYMILGITIIYGYKLHNFLIQEIERYDQG